MATLTAFCQKNGYSIESDPNAKIDDDLYLILAKEFNKDMVTKLEAARHAAERQERIAAPTIVAQEEPTHIETTVPQPKIVGKIELEADKKAKEEAARIAAEEAAKAAEEESAEKMHNA